MINSDYLNKLHSELIIILDEIDKVCSANNIKYFLAEGTLLGCVRHQGFIPWDDDLDIAMPRDDFDRFVNIAETTLDGNFELQWITTNNNYWQVFAKVARKGTLFKERGLEKFSPTGIFVDIFPLDLAPQYSRKIEKRKRWINFFGGLLWEKNSVNTAKDRFLFRLLSHLFSINQLHSIMINIMRTTASLGTTHYVSFGSAYKLSKHTFPKEWYGEGVKLLFEGRKFRVPNMYNKILSSIYGNDFMQLPPEEKRRCHYPEKVVFSDGETVQFEEPTHIVSIREQESSD